MKKILLKILLSVSIVILAFSVKVQAISNDDIIEYPFFLNEMEAAQATGQVYDIKTIKMKFFGFYVNNVYAKSEEYGNHKPLRVGKYIRNITEEFFTAIRNYPLGGGNFCSASADDLAGLNSLLKVEDKQIQANTYYEVYKKYIVLQNKLIELDADDNRANDEDGEEKVVFSKTNVPLWGMLNEALLPTTDAHGHNYTKGYTTYKNAIKYYWNTWVKAIGENKLAKSTLPKKSAYTGSEISNYENYSNDIGLIDVEEGLSPSCQEDPDWEEDTFCSTKVKENVDGTTKKEYLKIGPFQYEYTGTIVDSVINNEQTNNSRIVLKDNKNKNQTFKFADIYFKNVSGTYTKGSGNLKSGKAFYIYIPYKEVKREDAVGTIYLQINPPTINSIIQKQCGIIFILKPCNSSGTYNSSSPYLLGGVFPDISYVEQSKEYKFSFEASNAGTILIYKRGIINSYSASSYDRMVTSLAGVKFIVKNTDEDKYLTSKEDDSGLKKLEEIDDINNPDSKFVFKTKTGKIKIEDVPPGKYTVQEIGVGTKNKMYCFTGKVQDEKEVKAGKTKKWTVKNFYNTGDLNIIKVDEEGVAWEGIEFSIQLISDHKIHIEDKEYDCKNSSHPSKNKYVTLGNDGDAKYVDKNSNGSNIWVKTDSNGRIEIPDLYEGTYRITEKMPTGYVMLDSNGNEVDYIDVKIEKGQTKEEIITNKKKFVSIQGCVWEENTNNNLYGDNGDRNFEGITVQLIDKNNSDDVKMTTTTASNGTYKFENVLYSEIANYAVRFVYDGFTYSPVAVTSDSKGSKGTENTTDRTNLNNKFAKVKGTGIVNMANSKTTVQAINSDGTKTLNLDYITNSDGTATYDSKYKYTISGDTITLTKDTSFTEYDVKADTEKGFSCEGRNNVEIKNINLGLKKRQQADLSIEYKLTNVIQKVKNLNETFSQDITVSGRNYNYNDISLRYQDIIALSDPELYDLGLEMTLEYEIMITNETNLNMKVYELSGIANSNLENFKIIGDNPLGLEISKADSTNKLLISTSSDQDNNVIKLSANDIFTITIQATVKEDSIKGMYDKNTNTFNDMVISNVIEINKYTTYDNSWNLYAALDKDSAVGNISSAVNTSNELDNNLNFAKEDDISANKITFKSGSTEEYDRIISGNVFEDLPTGEGFDTSNVNMKQERKGNGKYDTNEKKIENVLVELIDMDESYNTYKSVNNGYSSSENFGNNNIAYVYALSSEEYLDKTEIKNESDSVIAYKATAAKYTNGEGYYEFKGILPGNYLIRFVWGDKILYKYIDSEGNECSVQELNDKSSKVNGQNVTVQNYKSTIRPADNMGKYIIGEWYKNSVLNDYSDALDYYNIRKDINDECVNISYNIVNNYSNKEYNLKADTESLNISISHKGRIGGVDFGLIERPKQDIQVIKEVSYVKLALANTDPIIQGYTRDDNGDIKTLSFATYLKTLSEKGGILKMELDSELVHGSTLNVTYNIKVKNLSEKDYNNENYYKYGIVLESDLVKTTINQMIDYMQNDGLVCEQTDNRDWSILTNSEFETKVDSTEPEIQLGESAKLKAKEFNQILLLDDPNKLLNIEPGGEASVEIKASKMIGSSSEDLIYNNDVEVIKLYNSVGRFMTNSTPGNHVPQVTDDEEYINDEEIDNDNVDITIVPPTGETRIYYVLGITSLLIIALGVVIIKKKVIG